MRWLKRLFVPAPDTFAPAAPAHACDGRLEFAGQSFDLDEGAYWHDGVPHPDLARAREWAAQFGDAAADAWLAVQREWMGWVAVNLGENYRLHE